MIRPLVLDDAFRAECGRLRAFAEDPRNWYVVGETPFVPGDRPEYILRTEFGFRAVFTVTYAPGHRPEPFRHLTVSVPGSSYPHSTVVFTLAHHLGFTGGLAVGDVVPEPGPWGVGRDEDDRCIVVQQPYKAATH